MEPISGINEQDLAETSYALGQLVAVVRDWDIVTSNLAIGFRDASLATGDDSAPRPAYTGSSQLGPAPAVIAEPNSAADQAAQHQATVEHWREVLVCLSAFDDAVAEAIDRAARQARRDGVTWSVIASCLGMTKQAAHQRYGRASDMGDRFESEI